MNNFSFLILKTSRYIREIIRSKFYIYLNIHSVKNFFFTRNTKIKDQVLLNDSVGEQSTVIIL